MSPLHPVFINLIIIECIAVGSFFFFFFYRLREGRCLRILLFLVNLLLALLNGGEVGSHLVHRLLIFFLFHRVVHNASTR